MIWLVAYLIFIPVCFFTFTVPGSYILSFSKVKFTKTEDIFIGTLIGLIVFTLISYLLLLLQLAILIPLGVVAVNIVLRKTAISHLSLINQKFKITKVRLVLITLLFSVGILGQLAIDAPSGTYINGDLVFWSAHGFDGTWHLALMEEIKRGAPFQNPTFAGTRLINYHFFSDIAPAIFNKYLPLTNLDLYFRLFPFLYSVLLGTSAFALTKRITGKTSAGLWAVFFTYFAGSFGYIVTYLKDKSIGGESIFWGTQIQSASGNPGQIVSDFMVLAYLFFIYLLFQKKNRVIFILTIIILGSLSMFKVYAFVVLTAGTVLVGLWQLIRNKSLYTLFLTILGGVLGALFYLPNVSGSSSFLILQPWWFIRTMIAEPSRLNWVDLELRRQTYFAEGNLKRVIYLETISFLIFFFGNLGTRLLGLFELFGMIKTILTNYFNLLFVLIISISFVLPLLFLQKGVAGNTSQFLQYFLLLFGILAGITTSKLIDKIKITPVKILIASAIIALSVPTQVGLIFELYSRGPYAKVDHSEIEALSFIRNNLKGVIVTPYNDPDFNLGSYTQNIWDWLDTSYVAALSGNPTYFDAKEQVDIMGYDYQKRLETKKLIFETGDSSIFSQKLKETNADILYYPKILKPKVDPSLAGFKRIYENDKVEIWKI